MAPPSPSSEQLLSKTWPRSIFNTYRHTNWQISEEAYLPLAGLATPPKFNTNSHYIMLCRARFCSTALISAKNQWIYSGDLLRVFLFFFAYFLRFSTSWVWRFQFARAMFIYALGFFFVKVFAMFLSIMPRAYRTGQSVRNGNEEKRRKKWESIWRWWRRDWNRSLRNKNTWARKFVSLFISGFIFVI